MEEILPQDVLVYILLRLPVKCLARAKCVSKSWLSLISNPNFARSHFNVALAPTHRLLLSWNGFRTITSIDFNAPSLLDFITEIFKPLIPSDCRHNPRIMGSCRGFVLVEFWPYLYIWNPCTGVQTIIPSPPTSMVPFLDGFGYDSSTDDYLITLGFCKYKGRKCNNIRVLIFSMRANSWKQFDGNTSETLKSHSSHSYSGGLFFNGAIHWLGDDDKVITAFDVTRRVFFEVDLPDGLHDIISCDLRVIRGFLSVCPLWCSYDEVYKIWVMEEYKVQSSWKSLNFSNLHYSPRYWLNPLCVTVSGDIVIIDHSEFKEFVKFNNKGELLEHLDYDVFPDRKTISRCVVFMHTHSLLSLPCQSL